MNNLNDSFLKLIRRSEKNDELILKETFVNVGPLITLLSSVDHQIIFGRRGTGKTHALKSLKVDLQQRGYPVIYIDLRHIGSNTGMYSEKEDTNSQRAAHLITDTLKAIHEELRNYSIDEKNDIDFGITSKHLDNLSDEISKVKIISGTVETTKANNSKNVSNTSGEIRASLDIDKLGGSLSYSSQNSDQINSGISNSLKHSGIELYRISFGDVSYHLAEIAKTFGKKIWILIDEWSSVPSDIQPFLADMLRRVILSIDSYTVKVAAVEHRSQFNIQNMKGNYTGIEIGADISADTNLDDFMIFDNDKEKARTFFAELFFRHINSLDQDKLSSTSELINKGFTQQNAFDELVRASEGVPRDAINIVNLAAQQVFGSKSKISVQNIRSATKKWFTQDKESSISNNLEQQRLLHWIVDNVIGARKARAFLLKSNSKQPLIDYLFDARLLHILKKNISTHDQPGIRYDAYKLDYGCYVDLISTKKNPDNTQLEEIVENTEVPADDYRSIRRAILNMDKFSKSID